jgi:ribosomal protein S18 acetylase RimI-like enzyme
MPELRYERLAKEHLEQVTVLHEACFEGYYLTRLGPSFLRAMYGWYVDSPQAIAHVAIDGQGRVVGFVAGTTNAEDYHRSLFRRRGGALLGALVGRLFTSPVETARLAWERKDLLPQALSSMLARGSSGPLEDAPEPEEGAASLVSIGVEPSQRRSGIGRRLTELFVNEAGERGCEVVTLSVREDNPGARLFYESMGWTEVSTSADEYHGSRSITYQKKTGKEDESR